MGSGRASCEDCRRWVGPLRRPSWVAIGAQAGTTIPGAVAFWDTADRGAYRDVLAELEAGRTRRLAFAVPDEVAWPLRLYELCLPTTPDEPGLEGVELTLVTPSRARSRFGERERAVGNPAPQVSE